MRAEVKTGFQFNSTATALVLDVTKTKPVKGEDIIGDPKLRKAYLDGLRCVQRGF